MSEDVGTREDAPHVVLLLHGVRTFAFWQEDLRNCLEAEGFKVEPINFGLFNLSKFVLPIPYFRNRAIEDVHRQMRMVIENNPGCKLSIIAHSFGTFAAAKVLLRNFDIKFYRVIFCGSVVPKSFPFEDIQHRFAAPILNEVGTRDIWPAVAESLMPFYGATGTYGFLRPLLRDRWHSGARHGFYLDPQFALKYWVPFLRNGTIVRGEALREDPRWWLRLLSTIKIRYLVVALTVLMLLAFFLNR